METLMELLTQQHQTTFPPVWPGYGAIEKLTVLVDCYK